MRSLLAALAAATVAAANPCMINVRRVVDVGALNATVTNIMIGAPVLPVVGFTQGSGFSVHVTGAVPLAASFSLSAALVNSTELVLNMDFALSSGSTVSKSKARLSDASYALGVLTGHAAIWSTIDAPHDAMHNAARLISDSSCASSIVINVTIPFGLRLIEPIMQRTNVSYVIAPITRRRTHSPITRSPSRSPSCQAKERFIYSEPQLYATYGDSFHAPPYGQVSAAGDFNGDGWDDVLYSSHNRSLGYVVFGASLLPRSIIMDELTGANGFTVVGSQPGFTVAAAGDVNGDHVSDIVLSSGASSDPNVPAAVFVLFGAAQTWPARVNVSTLTGANGFTIVDSSDYASAFYAGSVDLNCDGFTDIVISKRGGSDRGTFVVFGSSAAFAAIVDVSAGNALFIDASPSAIVDLGDINNDGCHDLALAAPSQDGTVYVVFGSSRTWPARMNMGLLDGTNGFTIMGLTNSATGWSVASAGKFNGDTIGDFLVGARGVNSIPGNVYLFYGRSTWPAVFYIGDFAASDGVIFHGSSWFGNSVAGGGDFNGDGQVDVFMASTMQAYVVYGTGGAYPRAGLNMRSLNGSTGKVLVPNGYPIGFGASAAMIGDVNKDGIADVAVASVYINGTSGSATLVLGINCTL